MNPASAMGFLSKSDSLLTGNCWPIVFVFGSVRLILLYPYAMATSSYISQGWMTSCLVGGMVTFMSSPLDEISDFRHIFVRRSATPSGHSLQNINIKDTYIRPLHIIFFT